MSLEDVQPFGLLDEEAQDGLQELRSLDAPLEEEMNDDGTPVPPPCCSCCQQHSLVQ